MGGGGGCVPWSHQCAQRIRHQRSQPWGPCSTALLFVWPPGGSRAQWATAGAHEEQGTWGSRTRKHREAGCGPEDGGVWTAKNSQTTPATTSTSSIRQLLGPADAQTAHHTTSSTAPAHQRLGPANAETTPARAPAAAADRKQRPVQHAKGRTGDCPGPRKETTTRQNVTQGGRAGSLTLSMGSGWAQPSKGWLGPHQLPKGLVLLSCPEHGAWCDAVVRRVGLGPTFSVAQAMGHGGALTCEA